MSTVAVSAPAEVPVWPAEVPTGAAFLDLEVRGDGSLRVGAMVSGGQPWVFTGEHLSQVEQVAPSVVVLAGHNVRRFDVPQLERLIGTAFPAELDARVVDTLELASLVFPGEPSQALDKLYREQSSLSDPVQDCLESAQVLARCVRALPGWGERAAFLSSGQSPLEQRRVLEDVWAGRTDILYVSPERLQNVGVQRLLRHRQPALWVLDEAHTLSQWGMDFRPDFLRIPAVIREVHTGSAAPLVAFVTATATVKVVQDLQERFVAELQDVLGRPLVRVPDSAAFTWRPEIRTEVRVVPAAERLGVIVDVLTARRGQGVAIVYVRNRALCESYAQKLTAAGVRAEPYHARIPAAEKLRVLQAFREGELDVVVATNAFGMGIDRSGIHTVIHAGPPSAPESYLQEIGRVARQPGEVGHALMLWDERDFMQAFRQESRGRIGGPKALKDCWDLVKKRLTLPPAGRWVSSLEFGDILPQEDPDELTTQARVALFALEAYDLMREGEKQPARLNLRFLKWDGETGETARPLLRSLQARGLRPGEEALLDVRETALLAGLRVPQVVTATRQLVRSGHVAWSYPVALRARRGARKALEACGASLRAFAAHLRDHPDADLSALNAGPVDEDVRRRLKQANLLTALRVLQALDVVRSRRSDFHVHLQPVVEGAPVRQWLADAEERWVGVRALADGLITRLLALGAGETLELNAADLDARYESELGGMDALEALHAIQFLGLANVARGESEVGSVFYLQRGARRAYGKAAFTPLELHYADRARRLHALRHILLQADETARVALLEAYFTLPLDRFCERHLPFPEAATTPQSPELRERILGGLSDAQRRVVTDDESRAILVLAGPGSGKTRTIVHRVANLVALRDVNPARVLVLAYNRTAVAEVRERLAALLGGSGLHVTVQTFHGLARTLTGLSERDAPREVRADDRFDWLIRQASAQLRDQPAPYQYVLVDEYQDVNAAQYELVTHLAAFDRTPQPTEGTAADGDPKDDPAREDDREQPGYLVAVGDDDQNLYTFQGANIEFIRRFQTDYDIPDGQVVPLLANYRARPRLVEVANAFIEAALPENARLKGPSGRVTSAHDAEDSGEVRIGRYQHRYHAALRVARDVAERLAQGTPAHELAVLAREWTHLHEVQHALKDAGVPYQLYNVRDQLRPAASLIGSALRAALTAQTDTPAPDAHTALHALRETLGLSDRDRAWAAVLSATQGLAHTTWGALALRIDAARPLARGGVILSTYHSAKGSEFDHVFVLNEGLRRHGTHPPADDTRALYVALTRARHSVTLLRREGDCHPTLISRTFQNTLQALHAQPCPMPTDEPPPARLRYRIDGDPADLYITAPDLLSPEGRAAVTQYARDWPDLTRAGLRLATPNGPVGRLRRGGALDARLSRVQSGAIIHATGATVLRCERDDEWYARAEYTGTETHHHHVLPTFEVDEPFNHQPID